MILIVILLLIIGLSSITVIIYAGLKIGEQSKKLKDREAAIKNYPKVDNHTAQSVNELYQKSYSHFYSYIIGHFLGILIDTYSIILSISALAARTMDVCDKITACISFIATVLVVIMVFTKMDYRSSRHLAAWRTCEMAIINISQIMSDNLQNEQRADKDIFNLIMTCYYEIEKPKKSAALFDNRPQKE